MFRTLASRGGDGLLVMSEEGMSIRVGSSARNLMSMGAMGSGTSWQPASGPSNMYHKVAGEWLAKETGGKCNVVELQGTVGSSPAINRKKGFDQVVAANPNLKIVRTQSGDFTRTKGKEVMESFIKAEGGGKNICAVYAHNDDMAIGAIQAIKEAGLKPGKDIKIVSIDAVPDIFKAMADGEANVTVELTPNMAGPALDALMAFKKDGKQPPKWIQTESKVYTPETAKVEYDRRKDLY